MEDQRQRTPLAYALARAALDGDQRACVRILAHVAAPLPIVGRSVTFAEGGLAGMFQSFRDRLRGRKGAEARNPEREMRKAIEEHQRKHEEERKKQFPPPDDDEVLDAIPLTAKERFIWEGNILTMVSSNVHQLKFDRGDGQGRNTQLFITFKSGDIYAYKDVPWSVIMDEVNTDSPGLGIWRWFREGTKPYKSKYGGRKIGHIDLTKKEKRPVVVHVIERKPKKR